MTRFLIATLVLAWIAQLAPAGDEDAKAVLNKAIKAMGATKEKGGSTVKGKGNINIMGMVLDFQMEKWRQFPNKEKAVIDLSINGMQIQVVSVITGDKGWRSVMGQVSDLNEEEAKEMKSQLYTDSVTRLLPILADKEMKISSLGETKVKNQNAVGIQVSKKGEQDVNLYFDKTTHLLLKSESRGHDPVSKAEVKQEAYYSDYKELAPGFKLYTKIEITQDGQKFIDMELTDMTAVESHDASIFAKPD